MKILTKLRKFFIYESLDEIEKSIEVYKFREVEH